MQASGDMKQGFTRDDANKQQTKRNE